jgi:hypothetical protein
MHLLIIKIFTKLKIIPITAFLFTRQLSISKLKPPDNGKAFSQRFANPVRVVPPANQKPLRSDEAPA